METIAESASDGIVAPLLFLVVGGPPLALAYKAVSTLDSMIGHRDAAYRDFGWASAKLDDLVNWIPARHGLVDRPRGWSRVLERDRSIEAVRSCCGTATSQPEQRKTGGGHGRGARRSAWEERTFMQDST